MNIKPIRTEQDYKDALKAIEPFFDTQPEVGTPEIGRVNRVYEVLNGKRRLTLPMIRKLHSLFGIPAESLINS